MDKTYKNLLTAAARSLVAMSLLLTVAACGKPEEPEEENSSSSGSSSNDNGSSTNNNTNTNKNFAFTLTAPGEKTDVNFYKLGTELEINAGNLVVDITGNKGDDDATKYKLVLTVKACAGDNYTNEQTSGSKRITLVSPANNATLDTLPGGKAKLAAGKINVPFKFNAPAGCTSKSVQVTAQLQDQNNKVLDTAEIKMKSATT